MWSFFSRTVLIVSGKPHEPALDSAFLHQPKIRLLNSYPDADGLKLARKKRPALIVEDLGSREGQDLEFCHGLRAHPRTRAIPLILVAESTLHPRVATVRADALLGKPLDARAYFDAVRRFLPMPERNSQRAAINLRFRYEVNGRPVQAFGRDVSLSGAFVKSDRVLPVGERLTIEFNLPGAWDPVRCSAIVRSGPLHDELSGQTGFGIEFHELNEEDSDRLGLFIEHFNRHQRS